MADQPDIVGAADRDSIMAEYDFAGAASDAFDDVSQFAAALCGTPIGLVTVLEAERQFFLAKSGTDIAETPRAVSFCQYTMLGTEVMVIPDMLEDERFADNPLVASDPHVRFYAGAPLVTPDGVALGSVCVVDVVPHEGLTTVQQQGLRVLARQVMALLDSRRTARARIASDLRTANALRDHDQRFRVLADAMPQMVWSTLPDGSHDYYNARWYQFTGVSEGSTDGAGWNGMVHPDDQQLAWTRWEQSLATGSPYEIEYRLRHRSGDYRWTLGRALPIRDEDGLITRWFGTCTDIHEQKLLLDQREIIAHELSHRIKNIFSVIAGLIGFSARERPELAPAADELRERVMALGRAHDFVRPHSAESASELGQNSLIGTLNQLFAPYQHGDRDRVSIHGPEIEMDERSATPIALLFHELATNSAKYGALSATDGAVTVTLASKGSDCMIDWHETGGPPTTPPTHDGFGSRLMALSVERQLGGRIERDWRPEGLRALITIPLKSMIRRRKESA